MIRDFLKKNILEFTKARIIFQAVLVGFISSFFVVLFKLSITKTFVFIKMLTNTIPFGIYLLPLITMFGGIISVFLVSEFAPETTGSGIPYVKLCLARMGNITRVRSIFIKFFAGIASIGTGMSLGREGPSVQIGAGVGAFVGKIFKKQGSERIALITAGAGSALGATFNAPISGCIFVLEELVHKFNPHILFTTLVATAVASASSRLMTGNNPSFNVKFEACVVDVQSVVICVVLGIAAGISGVLFSKTLLIFNNFYDKFKTVPIWQKAGIAGLITGFVGIFIPYILSSGNTSIDLILSGKLTLSVVIFVFIAKFLVTPVCFGSGVAGGIFLPILMLGSFLGYIVASFVNFFGFSSNPVAFAAIGMAGFLTSVARTPVTAVVMVFEMTGGYESILPIMLTSAIADIVAEKLKHRPIYSVLAVNQLKKSPENILPVNILVQDIMTKDVKKVYQNESAKEVLILMEQFGHGAYPVVDDKQVLLGIITKSDIKDALINSDGKELLAVNVMDTLPVTVTPLDNIYTAYYDLHSANTQWAIVLNDERQVVGIMTRIDIERYLNNF